MKVVRTFVAVLIAENLKERISRVQERIKKFASDVKWVSPENLHVTLKFLGGVPEDRIEQVCSTVEEAAGSVPPFELSLSRLGAFPSPRNARVVWIGIEDGRDELVSLARRVDDSLARHGFERESRPFAAHVTIGRTRQGRRPDGLAEGLQEAPSEDLGRQKVERVVMMRSDLMPQGPVYTPLKVVDLAGDG